MIGDFVELNDVVALALKMFDKFFWEFFQAFSLPIVREYPIIHEIGSLFKEREFKAFGFPVGFVVKDKDGEALFEEGLEMKIKIVIFIDEVEMR